MNIIGDVINELACMFIADVRMTAVTLSLVGGVAALILVWRFDPLVGGCILIVGCLAILIEAVIRDARRR